jgi:hypothetical protein
VPVLARRTAQGRASKACRFGAGDRTRTGDPHLGKLMLVEPASMYFRRSACYSDLSLKTSDPE